MNKKAFSERDICTKYLTPAAQAAGRNEFSQSRSYTHIDADGPRQPAGCDRPGDHS